MAGVEIIEELTADLVIFEGRKYKWLRHRLKEEMIIFKGLS